MGLSIKSLPLYLVCETPFLIFNFLVDGGVGKWDKNKIPRGTLFMDDP
jgi:hypothetical protein